MNRCQLLHYEGLQPVASSNNSSEMELVDSAIIRIRTAVATELVPVPLGAERTRLDIIPVCNEAGYYFELPSSAEPGYNTPSERSLGVLLGVVSEEERFDFCMCNPPFFASMEEAGLNPRTSCGGTEAEMVCLGGEEAFVAHIIEDSAQLEHVIQCVPF